MAITTTTFSTYVIQGNVSGSGNLVVGTGNSSTGTCSSITGGTGNIINSTCSGILGGTGNLINTEHSQSFIVGSNITSSASCTTFVNNFNADGSSTLGTSSSDTHNVRGTLIVSGSTQLSGSLDLNLSESGSIFNISEGADITFDVDEFEMTGSMSVTGSLSVNTNVLSVGSSNVGIGTVTPSQKLTVSGSISGSGNLDIDGNAVVDGNLTVGGTITAQEFHTEYVSASVIYESGSTQFGDSLDDTHIITGSMNLTGSLDINGDFTVTGSVNYSLPESGSFVIGDSSDIEFDVDTFLMTGSMEITGSQTVIGTLTTVGNTELTGSLEISGSQIIIGTLTAEGDTQLTGSIDITGSLETDTLTIRKWARGSELVTMVVASSTASVDFNEGNFFTLTLPTGSTTHISASNIPTIPQSVALRVQQPTDGTGSIEFSPSFLFSEGDTYIANIESGSTDILSLLNFDSSSVYVSPLFNFQ